MLIDDVKKIEKLKQKVELNPRYQKKLEKLEKKHYKFDDVGEGIQSIYVDKHKSKVAVMESGKVIQFDGPLLNPHFTGFLVAYVVLLVIGVPLIIAGMFSERIEPLAKAIDFVLIPAALVLNILTVIFCKDVMLRHKDLLFLMLFLIIFNVFNIIF